MELRDLKNQASKQQFATTDLQLASDISRLRTFWDKIARTQIVIERAIIAYKESRELLDRLESIG